MDGTRAAARALGVLVIGICILSLGGLGAAALPAPETSSEVAQVYQWILLVSVPALTSAIIFLWRALSESQKTIVAEVKSAAPQREELLGVLREMRAEIKFCSIRREREETADPGVACK